jgi:hypothetical protein
MIRNNIQLRKKNFNVAISSLFILSIIALVGCGSGGGGNNAQPAVSRELLAGATQKNWRLAAIRGNANYEGGGVDTPCPASLKKISNPDLAFFCGSSDRVQMRTNGSFTYLGVGVNWSLDGSTVTLNLGSELGILTSTVIVEPVAAGRPQRLRLRQISRVVDGVRNPDEDGSEIVIEEIIESTGGGNGIGTI